MSYKNELLSFNISTVPKFYIKNSDSLTLDGFVNF